MWIFIGSFAFREAQWTDLLGERETPSRKEPQWKIHRKDVNPPKIQILGFCAKAEPSDQSRDAAITAQSFRLDLNAVPQSVCSQKPKSWPKPFFALFRGLSRRNWSELVGLGLRSSSHHIFRDPRCDDPPP